MDVGLLFSFRNPSFARRAWSDVYTEGLDLIAEAERLGYAHVWLSEHHFADDGYAPSLLTIAAAAAARTTSIRIGTFVLLLPLHDPVAVAEAAATVDAISNGRLDLGLGQGYVRTEFDPRGIPRAARGARMEEGLEVLQALLAGESVTFRGEHNHLDGVRINPSPVQRPMPIWVGANGPRALDRAARRGLHLAATVPDARDIYRQRLVTYGRDPDAFHVAQLATAFCAETVDAAWDAAAEPLHHMLQTYLQWAVASGDLSAERAAQLTVPTPAEMRASHEADFFGQPLHIGTPDDVRAGLHEQLSRMPCSHLVVQMQLPGLDPGAALRSMELFADEVTPRLEERPHA